MIKEHFICFLFKLYNEKCNLHRLNTLGKFFKQNSFIPSEVEPDASKNGLQFFSEIKEEHISNGVTILGKSVFLLVKNAGILG